ncbi:DNA repair and recombination protein RadA [Candidatus Woesearchaeota archaeon]|nr:DNA repair and recombination protein RadA [Candidatus Woesearchaeota archaeon]
MAEKKKEKEFGVKDLPGVGAATAEKLKEAGYDSLLSVAVATPREIVQASGVGETVARKIINTARDKMEMGFESGDELLKKRENIERISTGSKAVDALLGGGVETNTITEMYGAFGSGKSAIAHVLAVNSILPREQGGINGMTIWIDTESTCRPERIKQIAETRGLNAEDVLKNIKIGRAFNSDHQMLMVDKIEEMIKNGNNIKLVIVDSLMNHFRSEFSGRGMLADRQQKLNKHIHDLSRLANSYGIAIYITNQVMAKPDVFFGDPTEAVGGHIVAHGTGIRIYLRRGKKGTRVAKVMDSPCMPEAECVFQITEKGIEDVE